jgi:hypothetical protein
MYKDDISSLHIKLWRTKRGTTLFFTSVATDVTHYSAYGLTRQVLLSHMVISSHIPPLKQYPMAMTIVRGFYASILQQKPFFCNFNKN